MKCGAHVRRMFAGGNTSAGFYSLYHHIIGHEATRTIVIKGGPGVGKSTLMKYVGDNMLSLGYDEELFHCSSDPDSLDGVVFPGIGVAIIDGTAPHVVDPRFPGAVDEILYLGDYWDESAMRAARDEVIRGNKEASRCFQRAYRFLRTAGDVLDDWSETNAEALDRGAVNKVIRTVTREIMGDADTADRPGSERHLFASAITPDGFINHLETVVEQCGRRFIVEGGPGSGKSTLIARTAQLAVECGFNVELFHCSLNPESLEHLVIPELGVAVITSVEPHVWSLQPDDVLIDMSQCLRQNTVDRNASIVEYDHQLMTETMNRAVLFLKQARAAHSFLESLYVPNIDFGAMRALREKTLERVLQFAKESKVEPHA